MFSVGILPIFFHLENCSIYISTFTVSTECTYPSNSLATGFLMLVQQGDPDQVHKLYVNQTRDQQSLVSVEVKENGTYLVSVIPVFEETGIIGSNVEYRDEIVLPLTPGKFFILNFCVVSYCIHIHVVTSTDTGLRMDTLLLGNDCTHT